MAILPLSMMGRARDNACLLPLMLLALCLAETMGQLMR